MNPLFETTARRRMTAYAAFGRLRTEIDPDPDTKHDWRISPYEGSGLVGIVSVTFPAKQIKRLHDWMGVPVFAGFGEYQIWRAYVADDLNGLAAAIEGAWREVKGLLEFVTTRGHEK
jgi:hypothetical protein